MSCSDFALIFFLNAIIRNFVTYWVFYSFFLFFGKEGRRRSGFATEVSPQAVLRWRFRALLEFVERIWLLKFLKRYS